MAWLDSKLIASGFNRDDINALPMTELQENMKKWIGKNRTPAA